MSGAAAASTSPAAAHAATQALLSGAIDPGAAATKSSGTAVDAVIAGVLALATRHASVLLGSGVLLIGGVGEGLLVIDGRARQPGLGAPRPRGYVADRDIPIAARISVPVLPTALVLAHAGRGVHSLSDLSKIAVASAEIEGPIDAARGRSVRAFGREGAMFVRSGAIRDALLQAAPRSLGGSLTADDLDAAAPTRLSAAEVKVGGRAWAFAPWSGRIINALSGSEADTTLAEGWNEQIAEIAIVAAVDVHGGVAIAAVALTDGIDLFETGLRAATLAEPTRRSQTRAAPGKSLPLPAPIALMSAREAGSAKATECAIGIGGVGDCEELVAPLVRAVSGVRAPDELNAAPPTVDEAIALPRMRRLLGASGEYVISREAQLSSDFGVACGVHRDGAGRSRVLRDGRAR